MATDINSSMSALNVSLVSENQKSENKVLGCLEKILYCFKGKKSYSDYNG